MKYKITTSYLRLPTTVDTVTGIVSNGKHHLDKEYMKQIVDTYKGTNRIYKPFLVLFYTDCMNKSKRKVLELYGDSVEVIS